MSDLAQLGFSMDTKGLVKGEKALDSFAKKGEKTEKKIGSMESGFKSFGKNASAAVASIDGPLGGVSSRISSLTTVLTSGTGALTSFAVGATALSFALIRGISETERLETNLFRLDALIKSTGKTSQITSKELHESARELALATLGSTEGIMDAQAIMLSFKAIAVESYDEVTEAALNVSAITGQNVVSSMSQLAKALEKPATGMAALSRAGVTFTESQIALAKELESTGDLMAAQRVILDELATSEGVARAAALGLSGAKDTLGQSTQELTINLNKSIGLNESLTDGYNDVSDSIFTLAENTDSLVDAAKAFATVGGVVALAMLSKMAVSTAAVAASTVAYNIQLAKMAGLTSAYAAKAVIASTATSALGVATRFALGPWGLLITAIGVATSVFISSKNKSDELKGSIEEQKKAVDELQKSLAQLSRRELQGSMVKENQRNLDLLFERHALEKKILNTQRMGIMGGGSGSGVSKLKGELLLLNGEIDDSTNSLNAMKKQFDELFASGEQKKAEAAAKKLRDIAAASALAKSKFGQQISALKRMQEQIGLTSDELVIYNATQQAAANNYTPEQTRAVIAQAEAFVKARKEYQSFQDEFGGQDMMPEGWMNETPDIGNPFEAMTNGAVEALSAVQGLSAQGSKDYAKLGVAIQTVNAIQAVAAVLNQAGGDPYTAFARMAAMVSTVTALGMSVGSIGGGFSDTSAQRQESQGVNSWGEKSESISNAIDMTADATRELVGINTDMLAALETLQGSLSSASGIVATETKASGLDGLSSTKVVENLYAATGIESAVEKFSTGLFGDTFGGILASMTNTIPSFIGKLIGGSASVTDEGVRILGGTISELINDASVFAYQEVKSKNYAWSSTKTREYLQELDDAGNQFSLVFESLANSVYEAGVSLGVNSKSLEDSINEFEVATTSISLKGLSIEDQQKEIEAVFSEIFNSMASSVIPFIDEFQKTGEELGETLTRIALQSTVAEYAAKNLGIELGDKLADPYLFAQISDNLSQMMGGVEDFASSISSFIDDFASDEIKLEMNASALTEALAAVGLAVPSSADGFWDLMQTLDGTTEAGREQIAALLKSQDVAGDYYKLLESANDDIDSFNESLSSLSESLRNTVKSIYGTSALSASNSLDAAISAAKAGDFSKALSLDTSSFALDKSSFGSLADFNIAQADVANRLLQLADLTSETASIDDMMLTEAQQQTALLTSINSNYIPQDTTNQSNVIMMEEIKLLRAEMATSNSYQKTIVTNTKVSADNSNRAAIDGVRIIS